MIGKRGGIYRTTVFWSDAPLLGEGGERLGVAVFYVEKSTCSIWCWAS